MYKLAQNEAVPLQFLNAVLARLGHSNDMFAQVSGEDAIQVHLPRAQPVIKFQTMAVSGCMVIICRLAEMASTVLHFKSPKLY